MVMKTPEELENYRELDVHTWSDHAEVNTFIDHIHAEHFSDPLSKIRKKHLKVVLLDLYVAWMGDPNLCLGVHLNEKRYRAKTRYNSLHISKTTILIIKRLTDLGLIHSHLGFNDRREGGFGRVSRIWPSKALISHFTKARFSVFDIHYHDARESVVLRDEKKKDIEYEDTQETKDMRDVLDAYNDLLRLTHIDCSHLDEPYVEQKSGRKLHINQNKKFVRRVFNNSSWRQGGRFHGGWWQHIGSEHRPHIRLDGERTIEVDYSGIHIVLLYAEIGINYFNEQEGDPYEINLPEINDPEFLRTLAKQSLLVGINARDEKSALAAIRKGLIQNEDKPESLSLTNALLSKVLRQLRDKHPLIADKICSGAGIELQFTDSQITEKIVEHFTSISVPVLCIHDSYIVPDGYAGDLREMMRSAWSANVSLSQHVPNLWDRMMLGSTRIKQIGYTDELEDDDPEEHAEFTVIKEREYISDRYTANLRLFREWIDRKKD